MSGGATWIVLAMMFGDGWDTLTGPPILQAGAVWVAVVVILVPAWGVTVGVTRSVRLWPHLLVPVFLPVVVGIGVLGWSQWRHPVETTACWTGFAVAAHLLVALGVGLGWRGRVALTGVLVVLFAAAASVQVAAQGRWFAGQLRQRGLTPVVPVVAGYHADGVNLGRSTLVVRMSNGRGNSFVVALYRAATGCGGRPLCADGMVGHGYTGALPGGMTLQPVPAATLARLDRIAETAEAD